MSTLRTYQNDPRLKDIRRSLRSNANSAEGILWKFLRAKQSGFNFRRQFSIGNVVADFYCHAAYLIIELDGWTHDFKKTQQKDVAKQKFLESKGYVVLRIKNEEVFGDIEILLNKIKNECVKLIDANQTSLRASPLIGERVIDA